MFKKTAQAMMTEPLLNAGDWEKIHGHQAFRGCHIDRDHPFCKTSSLKKAADTTKYLLSHCTILSSVMTEEDEDWLIKPGSLSTGVNSNDDAWENTVVKLSHESFRGAFNFVEHWQNSKFSKGIILDSVLRKIIITPEVWVYYVDILVGTDLTHEKLIEDIRSGKVKYLSMGCVTDEITCSYCGQRVTDSNNYCHHLSYLKGTFLEDKDGIPRRIAELCGRKSLPNGGVRFCEASWVSQPAFPGAVVRNIVSQEWEGPSTPYTQTSGNKSSFEKAASKSNPGEILLGFDTSGKFKR